MRLPLVERQQKREQVTFRQMKLFSVNPFHYGSLSWILVLAIMVKLRAKAKPTANHILKLFKINKYKTGAPEICKLQSGRIKSNERYINNDI